jgi:dTDP-4-dehydrorhamnose 3,5-epimerase
MLRITELPIPEVKVLHPKRHGDSRGFFSETYSQSALTQQGIDLVFVQDNHSFSAEKGTVRGLHFQSPPYAQDKLVRVTKGAILDVVVDIRVGSPTYGHHVTAEISAKDWTQILVPIGFAHGLITLEPDTEILYKVTAPYAPNHDMGIQWNDPDLAINWPVPEAEAHLSDKDLRLPRFADLPAYFFHSTEGTTP